MLGVWGSLISKDGDLLHWLPNLHRQKKTKRVFVLDEQLGLTRTYKLCISNLFIKPGTTHAGSVNPFRRQ